MLWVNQPDLLLVNSARATLVEGIEQAACSFSPLTKRQIVAYGRSPALSRELLEQAERHALKTEARQDGST